MPKKIFSLFSLLACLIIPALVYAYRIPDPNSNINFMYVFGRDGKASYGARKAPQIIFVKVPEAVKEKVKISIYDPDVSGAYDEKSGEWNTRTRFNIYGGTDAYTSIAGKTFEQIKRYDRGHLLASKTFSKDEYDATTYTFGPFEVTDGELFEGSRYFKIVAEGLSGDDSNLFAIEISPENSEAFAYEISIRLSEIKGTRMELYPYIPRNTSRLIENNYDLDKDGGWIKLIGPTEAFDINRSGTGSWNSTKIDVPVQISEIDRCWIYEITKDTQKNANMAFYITDENRETLPIYFRPGAEVCKRLAEPVAPPKPAPAPPKEEPVLGPKISCKSFTFDASKSYDPDNQKLSYLWDFGDGTTNDQMRAMHTYKEAGKYTITLTVKDSSEAECNTSTTTQVVNVNDPPCAVAVIPELVCAGDDIVLDGSKSTDTPGDKLTYKWDMGDGTTEEGQKITHAYTKGGRYQIVLSVIDDSGTICDTGIDKGTVVVNTPPIADAGKDITLCQKNPNLPLEVMFDGSNSKDPDGDPINYAWDFGDGSTAEGKVARHTYEKGGEYKASLIVTDNSNSNCNKAIATRKISLNRSPVAKAGESIKICLDDTAKFDASNSYDPDGDLVRYSWDFGDGEKEDGKQASHRYKKGGLYKAVLTVDDSSDTECATASEAILVDVNSKPQAMVKTLDAGCIGEEITFDGTGSGDSDNDKLNFIWSFGDGTTGSGNKVRHAFAKGGIYKATLVVDDGRESDCSQSTTVQYVKINTPPYAVAGPNLISCVDEALEFDASKSLDEDQDKLTYLWDFGDGETAEGAKAAHSYKNIGQYKVLLTVKDDSNTACNTSTDSFVVTVNAKPVPVIEVL